MLFVRVVVFTYVLLLYLLCLPFAVSVARLQRSRELHIVGTTYHLTYLAPCQAAQLAGKAAL
jgi:hypothetical protein